MTQNDIRPITVAVDENGTELITNSTSVLADALFTVSCVQVVISSYAGVKVRQNFRRWD